MPRACLVWWFGLVGRNSRGHCCSQIAEAEAAVYVNNKKWLLMHMHVQLHSRTQCCWKCVVYETASVVHAAHSGMQHH